MREGICPDPYRRIYIGKAWHKTTKVKGVREVWVCFGKLDEEGTKTVERFHSQPVGTQPMSEDTPSKMILDSIPERFKKYRGKYNDKTNMWLMEASWREAVSLWPTDTRIMVKETVSERNRLKRELDFQEEAIEEEGRNAKRQKGPEKGRGDERMQDNQHTNESSGLVNPLLIDYQDLLMTEEDDEDELDDDSTRKAWFDFDKPCSDTVTSRMGEILQLEHGLQSKPSKDLLDSMRSHRKVMAFVDVQDVFNHGEWKSWVRENQATSERHQGRPRFANLVKAMKKASLVFAETAASYDRVHKNQLEKAKEGGGKEDGQT